MNEKMIDFYEHEIEGYPRYGSIPMICAGGVHEHLADLGKRFLKPGAKILDVGCGRGAFALRMHDTGYDVDACDMYNNCMCTDQVRFIHSAAEDASFEQIYDAVFMIELLEHVESPFAVLRQYTSYLKNGGYLFISTPNVDSDVSRAMFLLRGYHAFFDEKAITAVGHITPVHRFQLLHILPRLGCELVLNENLPEKRSKRVGYIWMVLKLLRVYNLLRPTPRVEGNIAAYVFRKCD